MVLGCGFPNVDDYVTDENRRKAFAAILAGTLAVLRAESAPISTSITGCDRPGIIHGEIDKADVVRVGVFFYRLLEGLIETDASTSRGVPLGEEGKEWDRREEQ